MIYQLIHIANFTACQIERNKRKKKNFDLNWFKQIHPDTNYGSAPNTTYNY